MKQQVDKIKFDVMTHLKLWVTTIHWTLILSSRNPTYLDSGKPKMNSIISEINILFFMYYFSG